MMLKKSSQEILWKKKSPYELHKRKHVRLRKWQNFNFWLNHSFKILNKISKRKTSCMENVNQHLQGQAREPHLYHRQYCRTAALARQREEKPPVCLMNFRQDSKVMFSQASSTACKRFYCSVCGNLSHTFQPSIKKIN